MYMCMQEYMCTLQRDYAWVLAWVCCTGTIAKSAVLALTGSPNELGWVLISHQAKQKSFSTKVPSPYQVNKDSPSAGTYMDMTKVTDKMKGADGKFTFKIVWSGKDFPDEGKTIIFKQSTLPTADRPQGYEEVT